MDWVLLVLLAALTVRGLLRGTLAQVFAFLGFLFGAWVAVVVGRWVGLHWHDARPAIVYGILRWLVAGLAGLAVASVFDVWGEALAKAAHDGPFGWVDRICGGALGAATGLAATALLTLLFALGPMLSATGGIASRSTFTRPLVRGGAAVTRSVERRVPWGAWLHQQFVSAERRLEVRRTPARVALGHERASLPPAR